MPSDAGGVDLRGRRLHRVPSSAFVLSGWWCEHPIRALATARGDEHKLQNALRSPFPGTEPCVFDLDPPFRLDDPEWGRQPILCKTIYCFVPRRAQGFYCRLHPTTHLHAREDVPDCAPAPVTGDSIQGNPYARSDNPNETIDAILGTCCRSVALRVHRCFSRRPSLHCPEDWSLGLPAFMTGQLATRRDKQKPLRASDGECRMFSNRRRDTWVSMRAQGLRPPGSPCTVHGNRGRTPGADRVRRECRFAVVPRLPWSRRIRKCAAGYGRVYILP